MLTPAHVSRFESTQRNSVQFECTVQFHSTPMQSKFNAKQMHQLIRLTQAQRLLGNVASGRGAEPNEARENWGWAWADGQRQEGA
jgi:hypothetical protein